MKVCEDWGVGTVDARRDEKGLMQGLRNDYGDPLERWKVDLIRARAKRLFFREDEIPDIEQIIVMELLDVDCRPDISGGASETTFVIAVIDRQLRQIKRGGARYRRRRTTWHFRSGPSLSYGRSLRPCRLRRMTQGCDWTWRKPCGISDRLAARSASH